MTNDRDIPISASALPVSLNRLDADRRDADRRDAPTSLSQAEIHGLRRTRLLGLDELISPMVRRAVGYWMSKREADGPMLRRRLDAAEIPQLLPYLLLLEVVREAGQAAAPHPASGPRAGCRPERVNEQHVNEQPVMSEMNPRLNFRYRVIGDVSLRHSRGNYTGKCLSEVDGQGPGSEVWRVCTEVALQRRPLLSRPPYIGPLSHIFQCESAVMPLVDDEGDVTRVLIACDFLPEPARSQLHAPQHQRG